LQPKAFHIGKQASDFVTINRALATKPHATKPQAACGKVARLSTWHPSACVESRAPHRMRLYRTVRLCSDFAACGFAASSCVDKA